MAFNKYPHQLSGASASVAMIAQSISCDPVLLIADEPTTALDVTVQAEILDLMRNLHEQLWTVPLCSSPTTWEWWPTSPTGSRSCAGA